MNTLQTGFDLSTVIPLIPFGFVVLAIIWLMLAKMMRVPISVGFTLSMIFVMAAWIFGLGATNYRGQSFFGFSTDSLGQLGHALLLPAVMIVCLMITRKMAEPSKKIQALIMVLISCLGAMVTLMTTNWMLFFIGLQCLSLPLYGLLAFDTDDQSSLSSATRYLLLSFVAMAIMLFGVLLLYAATGSMDLHVQGDKLVAIAPEVQGIVSLGLIMVLTGIAFKISLFPFHAWAPEVYRGARLFVISYLIVIVKSVVVVFLMRAAFLLMGAHTPKLMSVISFMAILSMWVGNGMMLRESNFIRLLAFLSIGHLGALMIPILARNSLAIDAVFLDIIAFGIAMLLVFASLRGVKKDHAQGIRLDDLRGLYHHHPMSAITLSIALISLTGFPLTVGFVGKFAIFQAGVDAQLWHLIIHFVLSSLLGLAVIAYVVLGLWTKQSENNSPPKPHLLPELLFCAALAIVVMGVFPEPWIAFVKTYTTFSLKL